MIFLFVNKRAWKSSGPIVNVAVRNAHSFAARGFETHLCLEHEGGDCDVSADLRSFYGVEPTPRLHVHRIRRWALGSSRISIPIFLHAARLARELARRDRLVVITRETSFLPYLVRLMGNRRIAGFYELHDLYADLSWREEVRWSDRRLRWLERRYVPRISGLICITSEQQRRYRRLFPEVPSIAAPLGTVPQTAGDVGERFRARRVVYVGHLHDAKGVAMLLEATRELAHRGIRTAFWGGYEEQIASLRAGVEGFGSSGFVEFAGFRPPSELARALASEASVGLAPLQDTFYNRYLTCPVKVLDYLSHGLPVIGSDLPSVREVAGEAGRYAAADEPGRLIEHVTSLLERREAYEAAAAAACTRALQLSWPARASRLAEFTAAVAGEDAPRYAPSASARQL
jgi:glycosyltransferase involved in cell wall biosynthesis